MKESQKVVIDNGQAMIKAGFGGYKTPVSVFPNMVLHHKDKFELGEVAYTKLNENNITYPVSNGVITHWDENMELCIQQQLNVNSRGDLQVLITEAQINPNVNREKMTEIMFEKFNVQCFHVCVSAILSLYAVGKTTGVVVDIGEGVSQSVPIYEGEIIPNTVETIKLGGRDCNKHLINLLQNQKLNSFSYRMEISRHIKEKYCYIPLQYKVESDKYKSSASKNISFELPDKNIVVISQQRIACPQLLFNPFSGGYKVEGLHKLAANSITKCDINMREYLYENIVMSGGTSKLKGMKDRLQQELAKLAPSYPNISVEARQDSDILAWIGGSILSKTQSCQWITREDYHESGSGVIHIICP